jgi:hypothetical protein
VHKIKLECISFLKKKSNNTAKIELQFIGMWMDPIVGCHIKVSLLIIQNHVSTNSRENDRKPTSGSNSVSKECRSKRPGLNSFEESSPFFLWLDGLELTGGVVGSE